MKRQPFLASLFVSLAVSLTSTSPLIAATSQLLGWNNLGMHCMDSDYSVFSVLPPYNTIECQLIVNGRLVTNGSGYTVTYQAVADSTGSFNSTAMGKGNYYDYATALFGASLAPEAGLAGWSMPGLGNTPQPMLFEQANHPAPGVSTFVNWFRAEGIPISPYDDSHNKNAYPLMRLIARSGSTAIATNDIVLPVSDEMDCRACHASGSSPQAKPSGGWVWDGFQERDFRLNILRLHDEHQFQLNGALYREALAARGFNKSGLYRGVVADNKPVLCAACHASEALGAPSYGSIPSLTASVHSFHAHVLDPVSSTPLDNAVNRAACYRCHPGSTTRCLRGAMGGAVAADGSMEMQCQSCHGNMKAVGDSRRVGWFMEPSCQSCHSGTATHNNGQIRYTSAFDTNGLPRVPANQTFATTPNTPATGLSLYRFSTGHAGLQCSACHGSTHAEFPSTHANDNVRNQALQGHAGVMVECTSCHVTMPVNNTTAAGGPHGMHPVGQSWVSGHSDHAEGNLGQCQACHGIDGRGTVLSRVQGPRTLTASFEGSGVTLQLFRGATIGCYTCHNGPGSESVNNSAPPSVGTVSGDTFNNATLSLPVTITPSTAALRIISQPTNGSLGVAGNTLTYFPTAGFTGLDTFTYAAYDGAKNSNLATGTVAVAQGPFSIGAVARVPDSYPAGWPAAFAVVTTVTNHLGPVSFEWSFGDGSAGSASQFPTHSYAIPGAYNWTMKATLGGSQQANANGTIVIGAPFRLSIVPSGDGLTLSWPASLADSVLERSGTIGSGESWTAVSDAPFGPESILVIPSSAAGNGFYRARQAW